MGEQVKENETMNKTENNIEQEEIAEKAIDELKEEEKNVENTLNDNTNLDENEQITELKKQIDEIQGRLFRTLADFDNYKKRAVKEKEEIAKYASAQLVELLLTSLDNFERALLASNETKNFESLVDGVQMVYRQIEEVLNKEGLEPIEAIGQPFNPEVHQAVMQVETEEYASGIVVEELQKGYKYKGKVLRPSMVKVNA